MKATGIVRKTDPLGRVTLPIELRRNLSNLNDPSFEIFVDGTDIILREYQEKCIFCGENDLKKMDWFKGKFVCSCCRKGL